MSGAKSRKVGAPESNQPTNHEDIAVDWLACPNVGQASTNRDLRRYPIPTS